MQQTFSFVFLTIYQIQELYGCSLYINLAIVYSSQSRYLGMLILDYPACNLNSYLETATVMEYFHVCYYPILYI